MGKPKQVMQVHGRPMLEDVLEVFRQSKVDRILVILGSHEKEIKKKVKFVNEEIVFNPEYEKGMGSSLKVGLEAAEGADAVIVALADQPMLRVGTIDRLINAYLRSRAPVVAPVYDGIRGNPVLFDRTLFPQIMRIHGDVGAKTVIEKNKGSLLEVPVEDEGVVVDIDTPADYNSNCKVDATCNKTGQRPRRPGLHMYAG